MQGLDHAFGFPGRCLASMEGMVPGWGIYNRDGVGLSYHTPLLSDSRKLGRSMTSKHHGLPQEERQSWHWRLLLLSGSSEMYTQVIMRCSVSYTGAVADTCLSLQLVLLVHLVAYTAFH